MDEGQIRVKPELLVDSLSRKVAEGAAREAYLEAANFTLGEQLVEMQKRLDELAAQVAKFTEQEESAPKEAPQATGEKDAKRTR